MRINLLTAIIVLAGTVYAGGEFVSVDDLDGVFENYDKSKAGPGWADLKLDTPVVKKREKKASKGVSSIGEVTASSSGVNAQEAAEMAFDGKQTSKFCTLHPTMSLQVRLSGGKAKIERYALTSANDASGRDPKDWTLQGSNDGRKWDQLDQRSGEKFFRRSERREFKVSKPAEYLYYKLDVTKNHGDDTSQIAEIELL